MKYKYIFLMVIALVAGFTFRADADTVFYDGTFNADDWTSIHIYPNGTLSTSQVATGGNPGSFYKVEHNNFSWYIQAIHLDTGAVYNPSIAPINEVDWSQDGIAIQNLYGIGEAIRLGLEQDGKYYIAWKSGELPNLTNNYSWTHFTSPEGGYTASDFWEGGPDNSLLPDSRPDFSSSGSPITFGFWTMNNNTNIYASRSAGFDNWSVTVKPVVTPEPIASSLMLLGGAAMAFSRRRQLFSKA